MGGGGFRAAIANPETQKRLKAEADLKKAQEQLAEKNKMLQTQRTKGPGYEAFEQNQFEKQAGVTPPGYEGARNIKTGQLLDAFKADAFRGEASKRLRDEALSTGPSQWAKTALGKQSFEESQARGNVGLQQQQAQSSAMANLARTGGLGGGARTSLARSGARDALMAQQGVANQGILARYGINQTDTERRQQLLGQTSEAERAADTANIATMKQELQNRAVFDANRYNQQMQAWGAKQSADATRAAGSGGGGGKK